MTSIRGVIFDLYGTFFDVHSVAKPHFRDTGWSSV